MPYVVTQIKINFFVQTITILQTSILLIMTNILAIQPQRKLSNVSTEAKIFAILVALLTAFCALFLAQNLLIYAPAYPDFIVGAITWDAATKLQDFASYPAFVLGFFAGGWITYRLFQRVSTVRSCVHEQSLITALTWWLVPVAIGTGSFLSINPSASTFVLLVGVIGVVATTLAVNLHLSHGDAMPQQIGIGVLAIMLIGLLPFGVAVIQDRIPLFDELFRFSVAPRVSGLLVTATGLYFLYICRSSSTAISRYIQKLLFVAQLGIAPLYLLILPDLYLAGTGDPAIQVTAWLWVLALCFILASVVDVCMRYMKFLSASANDLTLLLSPVAIFTTIILLRNGVTIFPHVIGDDYHFGESLLGWWSFWEFGKISYIDYFPPHGIFGDDIGGFISLIFYEGTASTIAEADRLAATLTMFVAFIALRLYTGSLGLAYISTLLFGFVSRKIFYLLLVPFYCLWLKERQSNPKKWLWIWLISATVLVMLVPPQGIISIIASLPLVALYLYRARQLKWKRDALLLSILVSTLAAFTPIPEMLLGAIRYVLENSAVNQVAYGVPWSSSWSGTTQDKGKAILVAGLDVLRMSWVWIPLVAAVLIVALFRQRERWPYLVGVALPVLLFSSLMTPYSMGRIDQNAISRPGIFANFAWTVLLPILLTPLLATRGRSVLAVSVAFVCAGIGLVNVNTNGFLSILEKNQIGTLWSGAEHGLKNMGVGVVEPLHVDRLIRINKFFSSHLTPREAYLDLTGRNAQYMYFDRPPAMSTTAPYNMAPIKQQQRTVEQLSKSRPRIALLEADNINHDGGGLALRTHLLYRFVLDHYFAELHDGYVYGFDKENNSDHSSISFSVKELTDANWLHGVHRTDAAIIIRDATAIRFLRIGDMVSLPDQQLRKVTRVWPEGNAIWMEGARIDSGVFSKERQIFLITDEQHRQELSAKLMNHVFAVPDLRKVPVAWGLSLHSLEPVMKNVVILDIATSELHDLTTVDGVFQVSGPDPYLWINLSSYNLSGQSAGLLKFDFICKGSTSPRIQVFWWGDKMQGAEPEVSMIFTAINGSLIVPLDAYPGWLQLNHLNGLRIDLDSVGACSTISIKNISLQQRVNL